MEDDQGICRVCRSGPSPNQPLFHPCKCCGSIRFIHQECLQQWLLLSKKKYCEVCKYPFVFTPIYRDDMPDRLPLFIMIKQSASRLSRAVVVIARSAAALIVWLILLPTLTVWTWRFYFWSGENIGFSSQKSADQSTVPSLDDQTNTKTLFNYSWSELLSDCIQGQIITAVVVVVFVAAYLFREWVIQNTTPSQAVEANINRQQDTTSNEREQINTRLEELRREITRRRRLMEDTHSHVDNVNEFEYNNPYAANGSALPRISEYYTRLRANTSGQDADNDDDDIFMNPPSGTQSPFASWREYQQENLSSSLNHSRILTQNDSNRELDQEQRATTGSWRAREFAASQTLTEQSDYFTIRNTRQSTPLPPTMPPASHPPAGIANNNNNNNNNNGNDVPFDFVEDVDGILEAIGMRGNVLLLLKNSILMSLMINLCLCVTVWIPYVIGRSVILIHPINLAGSPVYVLRLLSDPVSDLLLDKILSPVYIQLQDLLPSSTLITIRTIHDNLLSGLYFIFRSIHITLHDTSESGSLLSQLLSSSITIHNWELVKDSIYSISAVMFKRWQQCAEGQGNVDRTVCTCVGYIILISIGSFYLSRTKSSRPGSTNETLRQQSVFLKVLFFIFLELVAFPTMCGVLLDISTLPLFTEWSIKSRFHFVLLNPYSGVFLHWFVGTGFIFHFSVFVALVREVVRPGVLYFIRDPNDPQFHPVQDLVEQPTLVLLRKLITTAATYFMLILVGMGLVTLLVSRYCGIYPIVWKFNIPISLLPIDLLAVQFILPAIMKYIVPREFSKKNITTWWHIVSRYLRLSSFMFGGRYPEEEGVYAYKSWLAWMVGHLGCSYGDRDTQQACFQRDGGFVRVPRHDNVPIVVPRRRMIVPIDPVSLRPLNEHERTLCHPAASRSGDEERDTVVVYTPPLFKLRIAVFLFLIWLTASILVCSISVVPLKLGRNLFAKLQLEPDRPIHDLYSFALGAFIMIFLSSLLNTGVQKYQLVKSNGGHVSWAVTKKYIIGKMCKSAKFLYIFFFMGFVIPFLIGVLLDLYIIMPIKLTNVHEDTLELYPTIDWAIGVSVLSIFYGIVAILPQDNALRNRVVQFNWSNFDSHSIRSVTRNVFIPSVKTLLATILLPSILTMASIYLCSIQDPSIRILIFRCAYPILLCCVCCVAIAVLCLKLTEVWLRSIRDDTYLIGRRLHNLE